MRELKYSIDNNGHGLIEMPCGTGKTITILSFLIAYKRKRPDIINKIGQGFFNIFTARWSNGGGARRPCPFGYTHLCRKVNY